MEEQDHVPIIEVTDENFTSMWPAISRAVRGASFVALDCELSGLGDRSKLNYTEIDMRYRNTRQITQEYSVISFGISCFSCETCSSVELDVDGDDERATVKTQNYVVQTFNILTLCSSKYTVECASLKFLRLHGFDFNKQFSHGLTYVRGEDTDMSATTVKSVFQLLVESQKPIVFHNGFIDLMFLYQSFYADLPRNMEIFSADLLQMFPAGIYDTKFISEFHQSFPATFLEYVFKKLQLQNDRRRKKGLWHCRMTFPPYPKTGVKGLEWYAYQQVFDEEPTGGESPLPLCESYKFHGWCSKNDSCENSHNIDRMARETVQQQKSSGGKNKRKPANGIASTSVAQLINMKRQRLVEQKKKSASKTHNSSLPDGIVDLGGAESNGVEVISVVNEKSCSDLELIGGKERRGIGSFGGELSSVSDLDCDGRNSDGKNGGDAVSDECLSNVVSDVDKLVGERLNDVSNVNEDNTFIDISEDDGRSKPTGEDITILDEDSIEEVFCYGKSGPQNRVHSLTGTNTPSRNPGSVIKVNSFNGTITPRNTSNTQNIDSPFREINVRHSITSQSTPSGRLGLRFSSTSTPLENCKQSNVKDIPSRRISNGLDSDVYVLDPITGSCETEKDPNISPNTNTAEKTGNKNRSCTGHTAGYDAFMTGYVFACDVATLGKVEDVTAFSKPEKLNLQNMVGKVYLIGKGYPFLIRSSAYGGTSSAHDRIIKMIRSRL